jgi:hypothetical protein
VRPAACAKRASRSVDGVSVVDRAVVVLSGGEGSCWTAARTRSVTTKLLLGMWGPEAPSREPEPRRPPARLAPALRPALPLARLPRAGAIPRQSAALASLEALEGTGVVDGKRERKKVVGVQRNNKAGQKGVDVRIILKVILVLSNRGTCHEALDKNCRACRFCLHITNTTLGSHS